VHSKPGLWLQLAALLGVAGTLLTVVSGTIGFSHEEISALAVPPLAAVVIAGWSAHRQLLWPSLLALALFGAASAPEASPSPLDLGATT